MLCPNASKGPSEACLTDQYIAEGCERGSPSLGDGVRLIICNSFSAHLFAMSSMMVSIAMLQFSPLAASPTSLPPGL
jgi:hypothetical protein